MSAVVEQAVRARKRHWCDEYAEAHPIEPGEVYARLVAFPDGDVNTGTTPWVLKICATHFTQYGRTMPEPRTRAGMSGSGPRRSDEEGGG